MAKNNKISMPQSGGGLVRYFDEYRSKWEIDPKIVVGLIIFVMVLMLILHKMNPLG